MSANTPMPQPAPQPTAADIRALCARRKILQYRLAAVVGVAPSRLSAMLNERAPLPPDLALRLARVIVEAD